VGDVVVPARLLSSVPKQDVGPLTCTGALIIIIIIIIINIVGYITTTFLLLLFKT
jgi:hypothetical protein